MERIKEIERRFLVSNLPFRLNDYEFSDIRQGYLSVTPEVKLKSENDKYYFTMKEQKGLSVNITENELMESSFNELFNNIKTNIILKRRYKIYYDNLDMILDDYQGLFQGLKILKVSFPDEKEAKEFKPLKWFGKEVTDDDLYKSKNLALIDANEFKKGKVKSLNLKSNN